MNFQTMDYFVAVAEERSFTKAAQRLAVTQQTLSANIAAAERELGVKLLVRRTPLDLTYAGEEFLRYARRFQRERRTMVREFQDIAGDERGVLRIGVTSTRGHIIMPSSIAAFQRQHPGIRVVLNEGENEELVQTLCEGRLDMVVATLEDTNSQLTVHKLFREEVVLLAAQTLLDRTLGDSQESALQRAERSGDLGGMGDVPFLLVGKKDTPGTVAREAFERSGIHPDIKVVSKNTETLVALALRGVGACFCPAELVATTFPNPEDAGMRVVHLGPRARYDISVAWRSTQHPWSIIIAFWQVLRDQLGDAHWVGAQVSGNGDEGPVGEVVYV
ncbi:MAG: LysR family transcriptional regulator [Coriobacteriales bacterium]|nr:LysR family transcriptional regulator [Coriobacteriales bacterium]